MRPGTRTSRRGEQRVARLPDGELTGEGGDGHGGQGDGGHFHGVLADELPLLLAQRQQDSQLVAAIADLEHHHQPENQRTGHGDDPDDQPGEGRDPLDRADLVPVRLVIDAEVERPGTEQPPGLGVQPLGLFRGADPEDRLGEVRRAGAQLPHSADGNVERVAGQQVRRRPRRGVRRRVPVDPDDFERHGAASVGGPGAQGVADLDAVLLGQPPLDQGDRPTGVPRG